MVKRNRSSKGLPPDNRISVLAEWTRHMDVILYVWNVEEECFEYISPASESLLGFKPEQFYENGYLWLKLIHPDDMARVNAAFDRCRLGERQNYEFRIQPPEGHMVTIHQAITPELSEEGVLVRVHGLTMRAPAMKGK